MAKKNPNYLNKLRAGKRERKSANYNWLYWNDHLRNVIKALIETEGLTRTELSKRAGIYNSALSNYLNRSGDKTNLTNLQLLKICDILGIEIELTIKLK